MEGSLGIELTSTSTLLHILTLSLIISIFGSSFDIILITAFKSYEYRDSVQQFIQTHINPAILIHVSKYVTTLFVTLQLTRYILGLVRSESSGREFPVKPLLFPCQTSHVRMFPKKHGFSYSYLMVGIPVGWNGNAGGMISSEEEKDSWYSRWFSLKPGQAWWTVNSDQYLGRGHAEDGLAGKLREYLHSQVCTVYLDFEIVAKILRTLIPSDMHMPTYSLLESFSTTLSTPSPYGIYTQPRKNLKH